MATTISNLPILAPFSSRNSSPPPPPPSSSSSSSSHPPTLSPLRSKSPHLPLSSPLLTAPLPSLPLLNGGDQLPPPPPPSPLRLRRLLRLAVGLSVVRAIHAMVVKAGNFDTHLVNSLMSTYLKLGRLSDARKVFDEMHSPDVVSYSSLISAYAKIGRELEAVGLFGRMRLVGVDPNDFSFVAVLTNCIRQSNSQLGSQVHALVIKTYHYNSLHVSNALMGMYVWCGLVDAAVEVFGEMAERDVSSWNAILLGMVKESRYSEAFEVFHDMQMNGTVGDQFSLSTLLRAAAEGFARQDGEAIHAYALKSGLELDLSVGNALIGFYSQYGCAEDVVSVFERMPERDVITWTGMLTGYMEFGLVDSAMEVFDQMPERNYITYNALLSGFCQNSEGSRALDFFRQMIEDRVGISDFTITSVISACAMVSDKKKSEQIHAFVIKCGCRPSPWVDAALIDMCAKCDRVEDSEKIFKHWVHKESFAIAWNSLLCAYARNGKPEEALSHFLTMLKVNDAVIMDEFTLATILGVCGALGFADMGKQMHCLIVKSGASSDLAVGNAVFSMYAKCGILADAISVFHQMPHHDQVSWNALFTAHLLHRQGDQVLNLWAEMKRLGINPNSITFLLIISACKYTSSNSVSICQQLFLSMTGLYNLKPTSGHYAAMIDVFGYWNCFDEAEELIESMPFKPDASVWRSLLDSCRLRSNLNLGRQAMQQLLALEPQDQSMYILASNLYSASGRWHCSEKVRQEMQRKGFRKHPARSWIVHQNMIHSFYARDRSHTQSKDIYSGLDVLILECLKAGYEPDSSFVLHEVEEYQKRYFLFYHSAKLAVMHGLLTTSPGQAVRVVKNIHLCGDCHNFMKHASSVTGKEISIRDASGFHIFKGGQCSCRDYW
ncbi:pentatricopeptide repeat-containing protein At5g03800 [Typha latifolia]|uniref:pentatricopeptide repeat-containing protein At5g03800 n=1 Tax=Typha latifolia TaxID=4733 RepID=UPI003C30A877